MDNKFLVVSSCLYRLCGRSSEVILEGLADLKIRAYLVDGIAISCLDVELKIERINRNSNPKFTPYHCPKNLGAIF